MKIFFIAATLSLISGSAWAQNTQVESFNQAKKHLADIFAQNPVTVYSGCRYAGKTVDYETCGYVPVKLGARSNRIEWEHVVPAEAFGRAFAAWRDGHPDCIDRHGKPFRGRHCAAKVDRKYRRIEADMYNLFPEVGELNARRSNYSMGPVARSEQTVDTGRGRIGDGRFEPPDDAKGVVARAYLYMDAAYPHLRLLSRQKRQVFEAWSAQVPVDAWECGRAAHIARLQGNTNKFVSIACDVAGAS